MGDMETTGSTESTVLGESAGATTGDVGGAQDAPLGGAGDAGSTGGQNPQGSPVGESGNIPSTGGTAGNWLDAVPEAWRASMQGFGSAEDAMAALHRGAAYQPATDVGAIELGWPEGTTIDKAQEQRYKEASVRLGLTPSQAQNLAQWQLQEVVNSKTEHIRRGTQELQGRWGTQFDANKGAALSALTTLDRRLEGRLAPALAARGVTDDPVMVEALYAISTMISEDSLAGGTQAGGQIKPMTTEAFVQELFANSNS
ncbi:MAG: hypothetical protein R3Y11_03895 [Pseudomonadota bacterium]